MRCPRESQGCISFCFKLNTCYLFRCGLSNIRSNRYGRNSRLCPLIPNIHINSARNTVYSAIWGILPIFVIARIIGWSIIMSKPNFSNAWNLRSVHSIFKKTVICIKARSISHLRNSVQKSKAVSGHLSLRKVSTVKPAVFSDSCKLIIINNRQRNIIASYNVKKHICFLQSLFLI